MTRTPTFYIDRADLDRRSPIADKMKRAERIHAMWLTGAKMIQEVEEVTKVDRLLLPDPNSKSVEFFQATSAPEDRRDIANEIRHTTAQAMKKNVAVRWLREFPGYSLIIFNPQSVDAWVQIEMTLPALHGGRRPSLELRKPQHSTSVDDIKMMFERLWTKDEYSREPNEKELPSEL